MWYINDYKDQNMGYAMNRDPTSQCAEEIVNSWEWWDWETGYWTLDPTATFTCIY